MVALAPFEYEARKLENHATAKQWYLALVRKQLKLEGRHGYTFFYAVWRLAFHIATEEKPYPLVSSAHMFPLQTSTSTGAKGF